MKFSVLMSVYIKENPVYLDLALKSNLEEQILKPNEFVLVCDGGLTKELDAVIDKYQKRYPNIFFVYRLKDNVGLGVALNYGLEKCTYELIARSDSDDICDEHRFAIQVEFMKNNTDVVAVGSAIDEFEDDVLKIKDIKYMPVGKSDILKSMVSRNPINHMSVMFRKAAVLNVGSYVHLPYLEDYYLWARLVGEGYRIENINQVLVHARVGNGMVKRRGNKKYIKSWKQLDTYMLKKGLISHRQMIVNMFLVCVFVFIPDSFREWLYHSILRNR